MPAVEPTAEMCLRHDKARVSNAALRVRTLHKTVLRRLARNPAAPRLPDANPIRDATVLLIGRSAAYPTLSVAFGERLGVVGALSIEAAAKHLNARDLEKLPPSTGSAPVP